MPTPTEYTRAESGFPGGLCHEGNLAAEIDANAVIVTAMDPRRISKSAGTIYIWFKDVLTAAEITELDTVVIPAHDNVAPEVEDLPVKFSSPPRVSPFPGATDGWQTWIMGAGDLKGPPLVRGGGTAFLLDFDAGAGVKSVDVKNEEPMDLHDGQVNWKDATGGGISNFDASDSFSFAVKMPASVPVSNPGAGNCNLVDVGGYNLIVPAAGDGSHDVDLADHTKAIPVPQKDGTGYWDVAHDTGAITANAVGKGFFHLLDIEIKNYFIRNISMGNPRGFFDVDIYLIEWIAPQWCYSLEVNKVSAGNGKVSGWLMGYREKTN